MGGLSKEGKRKREEMLKIFEEVHSIAYAKASPVMQESLTKLFQRFSELLCGRVNGGHDTDGG